MAENEMKVIDPRSESEQARKRGLFWVNVGILFSGFAVVVLIIALGLAGVKLLAVNKGFETSIKQLTDWVNQSENKVSLQANSLTDIQRTLEQNSATLKNQADIISALQKAQHVNKEEFLATEAYSLVKMAHQALQFENNIPVAIKLLQTADQDAARLTDPKIDAVRQALAADLVALQNAATVDVSGLYARLSALSDQLDTLPIVDTSLNAQSSLHAAKNDGTLSWWRRGLNSASEALQRIVIVRKNQPTIPPFITPDQKNLLYQNLHAQLEKAEWGLLHRQQDVYQDSLKHALDWIKRYMAVDASATKQMVTNLTELQSVNVHPTVPTVTNSLQAFQTYITNAGK